MNKVSGTERFEVLREVARLYIRQQREAVACCDGTSLTKCWIVTELGRSGSMTLGELARAIGFDKSWTSRTIDTLVAEGVVRKGRDSEDARRVRLSLSTRGKRRHERLNRSLDEHARLLMERIPASKRRAAREALALILTSLQQPVNERSDGRRHE